MQLKKDESTESLDTQKSYKRKALELMLIPVELNKLEFGEVVKKDNHEILPSLNHQPNPKKKIKIFESTLKMEDLPKPPQDPFSSNKAIYKFTLHEKDLVRLKTKNVHGKYKETPL